MWEVTVNIPVGEHQFKFLIDGVWHVSHEYAVVDDNVGTTGNNYLQVTASFCTICDAHAHIHSCVRRTRLALLST